MKKFLVAVALMTLIGGAAWAGDKEDEAEFQRRANEILHRFELELGLMSEMQSASTAFYAKSYQFDTEETISQRQKALGRGEEIARMAVTDPVAYKAVTLYLEKGDSFGRYIQRVMNVERQKPQGAKQ